MVATGKCFASMNITPIAILIYRRPALVRGLLTALQVHQPKKIWIIADGPKGESENELCSAARQQAEKGITWECEVIKIYADKNLGLKERVETGLDKLFAHENSAIILEEDCHPTPDFFPFCETLLEKYRNEPMVGAISGNCFLPKGINMTTDYSFSRYPHIWPPLFSGSRSKRNGLLGPDLWANCLWAVFHMGLRLDILVLDEWLGGHYPSPKPCPKRRLWPGGYEYPGCLRGNWDGKTWSPQAPFPGTKQDSG